MNYKDLGIIPFYNENPDGLFLELTDGSTSDPKGLGIFIEPNYFGNCFLCTRGNEIRDLKYRSFLGPWCLFHDDTSMAQQEYIQDQINSVRSSINSSIVPSLNANTSNIIVIQQSLSDLLSKVSAIENKLNSQ